MGNDDTLGGELARTWWLVAEESGTRCCVCRASTRWATVRSRRDMSARTSPMGSCCGWASSCPRLAGGGPSTMVRSFRKAAGRSQGGSGHSYGARAVCNKKRPKNRPLGRNRQLQAALVAESHGSAETAMWRTMPGRFSLRRSGRPRRRRHHHH